MAEILTILEQLTMFVALHKPFIHGRWTFGSCNEDPDLRKKTGGNILGEHRDIKRDLRK